MLKKLPLLLTMLAGFIFNVYAQYPPSVLWKKNPGLQRQLKMDNVYAIQQTNDDGYIMTGFVGEQDPASWRNWWVVKMDSTGTIQWQKELGGTDGDEAYSIQQTTDGGYIIAGATNSVDGTLTGINTRVWDFWIVKLDQDGNISWQKTYGGSFTEYPKQIRQVKDGGYIIAGWTESNNGDVSVNHGIFDYWVVKLTATGIIEWQKTYGGSGYDIATGIDEIPDGGYIVCGYSNSTNGDVTGNKGEWDYWLLKLSATGVIEWQKTYGGSKVDMSYSVICTSDKGYIVTGRSNSVDGDVGSNYGDWDWWIVKTDAAGNIQWKRNMGGEMDDEAPAVIEAANGSFIFAGSSGSTGNDVTGNLGSSDGWIVSLNKQGQTEWEKCYGGSSSDYLYDIHQTKDGGFIAAGHSSSQDGDAEVSDWRLNLEWWIIKLSPVKWAFDINKFTTSGNCTNVQLNWQTSSEIRSASIQIERSSNGTDYTPIGTLDAAGNSTTEQQYHFTDNAPANGYNYYRLKLIDSSNRFTYSATDTILFVNRTVSRIYPNPSVSTVTIIGKCDLQQLLVFDAAGKLLQVMKPVQNNKYSTVNLPAGTYMVNLLYDNAYEILKLVKH